MPSQASVTMIEHLNWAVFRLVSVGRSFWLVLEQASRAKGVGVLRTPGKLYICQQSELQIIAADSFFPPNCYALLVP